MDWRLFMGNREIVVLLFRMSRDRLTPSPLQFSLRSQGTQLTCVATRRHRKGLDHGEAVYWQGRIDSLFILTDYPVVDADGETWITQDTKHTTHDASHGPLTHKIFRPKPLARMSWCTKSFLRDKDSLNHCLLRCYLTGDKRVQRPIRSMQSNKTKYRHRMHVVPLT